ncbi:MAG: fumarylacetoacetate hydrolase family protein [Armatimonadota bacterium]|nr:fumarylacetoacetate hydrolase family protein [Armatimonadota bacterium]MDR7534628.1 fumarylacetoacetate hydrolase family protein [Armatimonadota bacterium]MDR7535440.1 fumarylacetoacetate hydrolase family protein [Armatimonadota bacterium]
MRFVTYEARGAAHLGMLEGDYVFAFAPLARLAARTGPRAGPRAEVPDDLVGFIERGSLAQARAALALGRRLLREGRARDLVMPLARARLLAPIPRPRKNIFCMGRNYAEHAKESGSEVPPVPVFFTKPPTAVVGPNAPVIHHRVTEQLDYEVELTVVIGRRGRDIPVERALDYVFGYTIMNDITARDLQRRHLQWFKGKSLDTFAPLGPVVVHRSLIPDPQHLRLRLRVNGEERQHASTRSMVFSVARLISALSAGMTLEPGDLLATGTPEGVAMGRTPPPWLKPGDVVEAEIEGIGVLRNPIVAP